MDPQDDQTNVAAQPQVNSSSDDDMSEDDAKALLKIADELRNESDQVDAIINETGDDYAVAIKDDQREIDDSLGELEDLSHQADLDDARGDIAEATAVDDAAPAQDSTPVDSASSSDDSDTSVL